MRGIECGAPTARTDRHGEEIFCLSSRSWGWRGKRQLCVCAKEDDGEEVGWTI